MSSLPTILIVHSDIYFVQVLSKYLEKKNFNIQSSYDSNEAVQVAEDLKPELMIVDYDMPLLDGLSTAKIIKSRKQTQSTHVILLISNLDKTRLEKNIAEHKIDCIIKPFDPQVFLSRISAFFQKDGATGDGHGSGDGDGYFREIKPRKARILIIENHLNPPSGLQATLQNDLFSIKTTIDLKKGLAYLNQHEVDLLFLDYSINNDMGLEICRAIKKHEKLSHTQIFIMAGRPDLDFEFQAVAAGAGYIVKTPLSSKDKEILLVRIIEAIESNTQQNRETAGKKKPKTEEEKKKPVNADQILSRVRKIRTTPHIIAKVNNLVADPATSVTGLAKLIKSDQAITSKILQVINSPYYGLHRKISAIPTAINYLGFDTVKKLCIGISSYEYLNQKDTPFVFDRKKFWDHSVGVASLARQIAKVSGYESPEDAFVAGLLHDVGKAVLSEYAPDIFVDAFIYAANEKIPFQQAEKITIGLNHAQCGGQVLSKWRLSGLIVESALYHHHSVQQIQSSHHVTEKLIVFAVKLANVMCKAMFFGFSGNSLIESPPDELVKALWLNKPKMEKILKNGYLEIENLKTYVFSSTPSAGDIDEPSQECKGQRERTTISLILSNPDFNLFYHILNNAGYDIATQTIAQHQMVPFTIHPSTSLLLVNFEAFDDEQIWATVDILVDYLKNAQDIPVILVANEKIKNIFQRILPAKITYLDYPIDPEEVIKTVDSLVCDF
ncbi:MAG: HDOD domain-containing protein [Thermodesulfobacteriota bacterium]|nr:HDOD domain-containing protein [Thermodesulfobacteriota bacterium]